MVIEVTPSFRCVATSNKQTKLLKNYCCKPMWKYKFLFDVKSFCKNHRCICVSYLPSKLLLLLPTLLQVIFDQAKRLVVIVNIMHSLHLRNKLCLIIKICIFKNHFLVKNKLQTPQLNPYLLVSPHPSRFSPLLNLGYHFYFWNRNKVILAAIWNKDKLFTFSQSGKCNLKEFTWFVSALI